ncbi:MAG TPA: hypothetical protein P5164_09015 [Thermoanaerobaculia bacterium]|nr:hypothetical protein [Thermoanaerobaculia bacterium]
MIRATVTLLPRISALENVEMPPAFGGLPLKVRRAKVSKLLGKVGLGDRMDHEPRRRAA